MSVELAQGKWTLTKTRMWGLYRHPTHKVISRLPAYDEAREKYIAKGFTFIRYCDDTEPAAQIDMSTQVLDTIVPKQAADINPVPESTPAPDTEPVELYVAEHPYRSKKKTKRKYTRRSQ